MKRTKMERLNLLFEKMVADNANNAERFELRILYQEYLENSRDVMHQTQSIPSSHRIN